MRYMVCVDGSKHAHKAFELAYSLHHLGDDFIYLLTVAGEKSKEESIKIILDYERECKDRGVKYEAILVEGKADARDAILHMSQKYHADMLVVGTRGLSSIRKMVIGSVSSYCVANSTCDVLVAK
eukprot:TRINITY_DN424_c0_g1_i1.p1 TRINITY_DN424_c0_g1~~TRINITY_DN424_c0_g1_i1.p1  ORF type:complete len:125 (-),score=26.46 TRINITY_DN424_c0_g1_i1:97-471(-)